MGARCPPDASVDADAGAVRDASYDAEGADAAVPTADCGPMPGGMDCLDECGVGFVSPSCTDGNWVCGPVMTDPTQMSCSCLPEAWQSFVWQHQACATADDCVVVGATNDCACTPSIGRGAAGTGSGYAIDVQSLADAQAYLHRFEQCKTLPGFVNFPACGAAPATNLRCANGKCTADPAECADAGDAGSD